MKQMIKIEIHIDPHSDLVAGFIWFQIPIGVSHPQKLENEPNLFNTFYYNFILIMHVFWWCPCGLASSGTLVTETATLAGQEGCVQRLAVLTHDAWQSLQKNGDDLGMVYELGLRFNGLV